MNKPTCCCLTIVYIDTLQPLSWYPLDLLLVQIPSHCPLRKVSYLDYGLGVHTWLHNLACHKLGYHYKSKNQFGDGLVPGKNDHLSFHLQQWLWHLEVGWMPWYSFFHLHINGHLCVTVTHLFASLELLMAAKKKERYISDPSDAAVKVLKDDQACQNCHQRKGTRADKYIVDLICPVTKRHT